MASHCAHCRSTDVVHNANTYTCFNCSESTSYEGVPLGKNESSEVVVTGRTPDLSTHTYDELYDLASDRDITGRSSMNKDELVEALQKSR